MVLYNTDVALLERVLVFHVRYWITMSINNRENPLSLQDTSTEVWSHSTGFGQGLRRLKLYFLLSSLLPMLG